MYSAKIQIILIPDKLCYFKVDLGIKLWVQMFHSIFSNKMSSPPHLNLSFSKYVFLEAEEIRDVNDCYLEMVLSAICPQTCQHHL